VMSDTTATAGPEASIRRGAGSPPGPPA